MIVHLEHVYFCIRNNFKLNSHGWNVSSDSASINIKFYTRGLTFVESEEGGFGVAFIGILRLRDEGSAEDDFPYKNLYWSCEPRLFVYWNVSRGRHEGMEHKQTHANKPKSNFQLKGRSAERRWVEFLRRFFKDKLNFDSRNRIKIIIRQWTVRIIYFYTCFRRTCT